MSRSGRTGAVMRSPEAGTSSCSPRRLGRPRAPKPEAAPAPGADSAQWTRSIVPDSVLLFRYSAVTFNSHRIHYDADYVRDKEGYPDLVMNGGLMTLLLWELATSKSGRELR